MKHLIHSRHHPHLKKRALLELVGLAILVLISVSQWEIVQEAIRTVSSVNAVWLVLLMSCYWLILPLTAFSYRLISPKPKKVKISTTTLAHLAGAGPGRIIPGGIGNLSIGAMHLKKTGLTIEKAVAVVATNNLIGVLVTITLVITAFIIRPETFVLLEQALTSQQLIFLAILLVGIAVLVQWLFHARGTRREANKTLKEWKKLGRYFIKKPLNVWKAVFIAIIITLVHTFMLDFAGFAVGVDVKILDALIALSLGVALGGILPTPGGFGGVEAGTSAALIVLGYDAATATSIALLFRIATYWQPLIPGTFAYLYLRERKLL